MAGRRKRLPTILVVQSRGLVPGFLSLPDTEQTVFDQQPEPEVSVCRWLETHVAASGCLTDLGGVGFIYRNRA